MTWHDTIRLHHGDYRETLALCDGAADLVLTSPPYADARTYGMGCNWTMDDYAALGDAVFAALRPGGHALINIDAPVREWRPGFGTERGFHPWRMMLDWAERVGFRVPDRLVYGRFGIPGEYPGRFRCDWEPVIWFQKPGPDAFLDKRAIAEDGAENYAGRVKSRRLGESRQKRAASGWAAENQKVMPGTLWMYGRTGSTQSGAPTSKPKATPPAGPTGSPRTSSAASVRPVDWHATHSSARVRRPPPRSSTAGASSVGTSA